MGALPMDAIQTILPALGDAFDLILNPGVLAYLGLGVLMGLAVGVFASKDDVLNAWQEDRQFKPEMDDATRDRHLQKWARAVERA